MSARRIPRGAVISVCAALVALPGAFALAGPYRSTTEGVPHRHIGAYDVFNDINGSDTQLKNRATDARVEWHDDLSQGNDDRRPAATDGVRLPWIGTATGAEIRFEDDLLGDSELAVAWTNSGFHPSAATVVTFNRSKTNNWTGDEKQSRTCNALGNILGLADGGVDRSDCMKEPGVKVGVWGDSLSDVQDFYGPNLSISGSLYTSRDDLKDTRSYSLSASASGHAMKSVEILLDGQRKAIDDQPACAEKCTRSASWSPAGETLADGEHTVRVVATNDFGQTDVEEFKVLVSAHTGIMRQYSFESERLWDRGAVKVNVVNGNLVVEQNDLQVAGTTLDLAISRYYNSLTARGTELGPRWAFDTASGVELKQLDGGDLRFFGPSGYAVRFNVGTGSGNYDTPTGIDATLTDRSGGGWNLDLLQSQERYVFDAQGRFTEHVNQKSDQRITFAYDGSSSRVTRITDTQERQIDFAHWTQADVTAGLAPQAAVGQVRSITTPTVNTVTRGQRQTKWHYSYDSAGRLVRAYVEDSTTSDGQQGEYGDIEYTYDGSGRLTQITDPNGVATRIAYVGSTNKVEKLIRPASVGETDAGEVGYVTSFDFRNDAAAPCQPKQNDSDWERTIVTAPRGNETSTGGDFQTTYCHDAESRVKQVYDAKNQRQELSFTAKSNVQSYTSGAGSDTDFSYDSKDRLTRTAEAGGAATTLSYGGGSWNSFSPQSITGPLGNATAASSTDNQLVFGYEGGAAGTGNLETVTTGTGQRLITLDHFKAGDASMTDTDWKGLLESSTDGENHKTTYEYDGAGNLIKETPPKAGDGSTLQGDTRYEYDALSQVSAVIDANGVRRTIEYDALGRPLATRYPANQTDGDSVRLAYDPNGNLLTRTDGRQGEARSDQRDEYTYNSRNLRTIDKLRGDREIRYAFDPNGNLIEMRYVGVAANDVVTNYAYDQLDLIEQITEPAAAGTPRPAFQFQYRGDNQLSRLTLPNGVVQRFDYITVNDPSDSDSDGKTTEPTGDMRSIRAFAPSENPDTGTPSLVNLIYDYDADYDPDTKADHTGVVQRVRDLASSPNLTTEYDYDDQGRLDKVREDGTTRYDYDYDLDSNLTRADERGTVTTYAYNPVHEITQINGSPAGTYDANGNVQSLQGQTFSYDQRSRTRSIDPPGTAPAISFDYADESQAERWMKGDTEFWDTLLGTSVEDPPSSGEDRIYYTRAPQGQVLSMLRDLGSRSGDYYPLTDHLGTTVALTDSNGGLTTRYRYEPYGQQIGTPSGPAMPWRFAGQYLDTETSLYKMGLRFYDPGTMRWTQKDPLNLFQDPKQGNRYSYAGSDPVNNADPSGADYCTEQGACFYQDSSYSGGATVPDPCAGLYDLHPECMRSYGSNAVSGFFSGLTGCLTGFLNPFGSCKGGAFLGPLLDPLLDPDPAY